MRRTGAFVGAMSSTSIPCVLTIAGSDPSGGAGIQGDLKTFTVLHAFGMAVITALTAQNTTAVTGVHAVPTDFVTLQLETLFADMPVHATKTGMLATAELIHTVVDFLDQHPAVPLVADPVMVATSGARLLAGDAVEAVRRRLMPRATVATPNAPEAEVLTGRRIECVADAVAAAHAIAAMGPRTVIVKGGDSHLVAGHVVDVIVHEGQETVLQVPRVETNGTHGSGCALAAAITVGLARGMAGVEAIQFARAFVARALAQDLKLGHGHSPINHLAG